MFRCAMIPKKKAIGEWEGVSGLAGDVVGGMLFGTRKEVFLSGHTPFLVQTRKPININHLVFTFPIQSVDIAESQGKVDQQFRRLFL